MAGSSFDFKQFSVYQEKSAFKVGTDGVLLGAVADVVNKNRILDIGTGTGLMALMAAQRCEGQISAIEPDKESFAEASDNVARSKWKNRINVINTDLQTYFPDEEKFDLIISNPPFFSNSLKNPDLRRSASRHNDSLTTEELFKGVTRLLNKDGIFQVIMPYAEGNILIAEAQKYDLYCNKILKIKPLTTSEIRRLIITFSRERMKVIEKFLTIEHGARHDFTEEYKSLTKDFYLKF
jgi:tRNA1Val (adenine37-N6)-methyltransferase